MSDPSEPRKRGRPRVDPPRSTVSAWIPSDQHDRLIQTANRHDMSVSALVRGVIDRWTTDAKRRPGLPLR